MDQKLCNHFFQSSFSRLNRLALAFMLIAFCGCDKVCKYTVNDIATVHNLTGRPLSLTVCKIPAQKQQIEVPADQVSTVSLGQSQGTKIQGGGDALKSCATPSDQSQSVGFTLSKESFNDVTLCRNATTLDRYIVDVTNACPEGTQAQSTPVICQ